MPDPLDPAATPPVITPAAPAPWSLRRSSTQPVNVTDAWSAAALATERARATDDPQRGHLRRLERVLRRHADQRERHDRRGAHPRVIDQIATGRAEYHQSYSPGDDPGRAVRRLGPRQSRPRSRIAPTRATSSPPTPATSPAGASLVLARDWLDCDRHQHPQHGRRRSRAGRFPLSRPGECRPAHDQRFPVADGLDRRPDADPRRAYDLAPQTFRSFCRRQPGARISAPSAALPCRTSRRCSPSPKAPSISMRWSATSPKPTRSRKWGHDYFPDLGNDHQRRSERVRPSSDGDGPGSAQVESDMVYAILLGNPNMAETIALFDATHGNLANAAGAAISSPPWRRVGPRCGRRSHRKAASTSTMPSTPDRWAR